MDLLTKGALKMTAEGLPMVTAADDVQGPEQGHWTYNDYSTIPDDGKRYEVVNGVLFMSPAPSLGHQEIVGEIFVSLRNHIKLAGLGKVYMAPVDVELNPKTIVQPDILVVLTAHLDRISDKRIIGPPDLVVEVISPGTAMYDRREKLDAYIEAGVTEYWIVEPASHTVEVLSIGAGTYHSRGIFEGKATLDSQVIPDFPIQVEQFFS